MSQQYVPIGATDMSWARARSFVREAVLEKFDKESLKNIPLRTVAELDTRTETEKKDKDAPRIPVKPE